MIAYPFFLMLVLIGRMLMLSLFLTVVINNFVESECQAERVRNNNLEHFNKLLQ